ncbi:hypothetical protein C8Q78DRAFT_1080899 [Trametes maxima]|nr:hypothetical protein C8Q78DRAFT_1080899 [Trametes maxima]
MSTPLEAVLASAEYWVSSVRFNNELTLVAFAILYYDYLLTLSNEIDHFWRTTNLSVISVLFVVNRYLGLLGPVPSIVEYFANLPEQMQGATDVSSSIRDNQSGNCSQCASSSNRIRIRALLTLSQVILVIRTYALYNRSKRILALLLVTHIGGAIVCGAFFFTSTPPTNTSTPLPFSFSNCDLSLTNKQAIHLTFAWSAMMWFDTTVFVLTLIQALRVRRHFPGGLLEIMLRDGTIYYGMMLTANACNIITFMANNARSPLKGMDTTLSNVLSTTLTSRLILNLRNPDLHRPRHDPDDDPSSVWNSATEATSTTIRSTAFDCDFTEVVTVPMNSQSRSFGSV